MNRAVAYCRFSSLNQREESIEAQVRAIKKYCNDNRMNLVKIYKDEAISGVSTKDREEFLKLIEDAKNKEFEYVVVHKFDRFARNMYDHAVYEKKLTDNNIKLISVLEYMNDSPESIILKSLLTGMNEYYVKNLSREVKKGLNENALKGKHNGGKPPLGYDLDENRKYIINKKEAEAVKIIFNLANNGMGYAKIAEYLNKEGYKNKLGKEFKKVSIRDTLLNVKYIGTYYFNLKDANGKLQKKPILIENNHEAIIEKNIFYNLQQKFKDSKKKPRKRETNNSYILTGFCKCGLCGGAYSGGYRSKNRNGTVSYGYLCRKRKDKEVNCRNKPIRKELLENSIYSIIQKEIFSNENIEKIVKDMYEVISNGQSNSEKIKKCKKELKHLEEMALKLLEKSLEGHILESIFILKNEELKHKILSLKGKISSLEKRKEVNQADIKEYILKLKKESTETLKRNVVETFLKEILIYPEKIEIKLRNFPNMAKYGGSDGTFYISLQLGFYRYVLLVCMLLICKQIFTYHLIFPISQVSFLSLRGYICSWSSVCRYVLTGFVLS